jgi:pilus assembly protein Flp/PilA
MDRSSVHAFNVAQFFQELIMQTSLLKQFWQDQEGATAIEYGLIAGLISIAIIAAVTTMGTSLGDIFTTISDKLSTASTKVTTP